MRKTLVRGASATFPQTRAANDKLLILNFTSSGNTLVANQGGKVPPEPIDCTSGNQSRIDSPACPGRNVDPWAAAAMSLDENTSSHVLREVIRDVPLLPSDESPDARVHITCVDAWEGNLYIGTSAGEVLHYVSLPPGPGDLSPEPTCIFATKLQPTYNTAQEGSDAGVKQILLLPNAGKACVLCNGTLTFYTLPELSPAFGNIRQSGCLWVGGVDHGSQEPGALISGSDNVVAICLRQKLRLIRIGKEARRVRDIELGGVSLLQRRGELACVADTTSYSLLDLVNHRKNELFPISSSATITPPDPLTPPPSLLRTASTPKPREPSRSFSTSSPVRIQPSHERNVSVDSAPKNRDHLRPDDNVSWPTRGSSRQAAREEMGNASRESSPAKEQGKVQSPRNSVEIVPSHSTNTNQLPPNIVSTSANEFLLTVGTKLGEPGVGMFVNDDGDAVRGTLSFASYPDQLVIDFLGHSAVAKQQEEDRKGFLLALVRRVRESKVMAAIEVRRWAANDDSAIDQPMQMLDLGPVGDDQSEEKALRGIGLRVATTSATLSNQDILTKLRLRRFSLDQGGEVDLPDDSARNADEDRFASRFAQTGASVLFYRNDKVFWVAKSPLVAQLDADLLRAVHTIDDRIAKIDVAMVQHVLNDIRGQEAGDELEFHTLTYIRQKCSLLLFGHLLLSTANGMEVYDNVRRLTEDALLVGEIDPRVMLSLVPPLDVEVVKGEQGLWMAQGLIDTVRAVRASFGLMTFDGDSPGAYGYNLLGVIVDYLAAWRRKKGLASVADEEHIFQTVDAAYLQVLLMLDRQTAPGPAAAGSIRAELNNVVDNELVCFDRAVYLLEQNHRPYLLSRLYQSRKLTGQVLATWRRIIQGERDDGGELIDGEQVVRRYLPRLKDSNLVQEYGCWLAQRNPTLGVQVFADKTSKVKFQPTEAVDILRRDAPNAVKHFLEHLVFGQNHLQYVNELIAYYLDSVIRELETSDAARQSLLDSYATYRALQPPKPTYRQFVAENSVESTWWQNRLRLLQLVDGSHDTAGKYDIRSLRNRLRAHEAELLPEMIVLNAKQGTHGEALGLLTNGLADYDTAIRYCLLGGSNIFHSNSMTTRDSPGPTREEQSALFEILLDHFLHIEAEAERLERTAELLGRFGGWFDVAKVLEILPDTWPVEAVAEFLVQALRSALGEKNETSVVKALSSAQNLRQAVYIIDKLEDLSPVIVYGAGTT